MRTKTLFLLLLVAFATSTGQMKITPVGVTMVKHFEGFRSNAYLCPAGVWTIAYGATEGVRPGMIVTPQEGQVLLLKDMVRFENYVNKMIYRLMKWHEFDAIVSFSFNVGYRFSGKSKNSVLHDAINSGNTKVVVYKLSLYNKAKVDGRYIVLPGLVARRRAESFLYEYGQSLIK